MEKLTV